jgi:hypothetical protein
MNVNYQVASAPPCEDVQQERNEMIKACRNMGQVPAAMEMFNERDRR